MADGTQYPDGKIHESDDGKLSMEVIEIEDNVVIDFGKPVVWFGMPLDYAVELALILIQHAKKIGLTKPLEIKL